MIGHFTFLLRSELQKTVSFKTIPLSATHLTHNFISPKRADSSQRKADGGRVGKLRPVSPETPEGRPRATLKGTSPLSVLSVTLLCIH